MKKESDLWKLLKKNTPQIRWTRLESWSSFGVCDCLGYHDHCGFFMVELKLIKNEKLSSHHIKNYSIYYDLNVISSCSALPFLAP